MSDPNYTDDLHRITKKLTTQFADLQRRATGRDRLREKLEGEISDLTRQRDEARDSNFEAVSSLNNYAGFVRSRDVKLHEEALAYDMKMEALAKQDTGEGRGGD